MQLVSKIVRADALRKSRFHTANGKLCLHPGEMLFATVSTVLRHATGRLLPIPWLTFPAVRYIKTLPSSTIVFEFGSGMSTSWYGKRFREVFAVEHDPEWFARIRDTVRDCANVHIALHEDRNSYVTAIDHTPHERFDMIVIDGAFRLDCLRHSLPRLKPNGVLVLDNTDVEAEILEELAKQPMTVRLIFPGYAAGILHPNETMVLISK
jgi:predicted O-methyltransferase YrrM